MKKVLVHGSSSMEQLILSFPALHALKKESTDDEIYLALFEHTQDAVKYLAFDVKQLLLPGKYGNIFDAHRFAGKHYRTQRRGKLIYIQHRNSLKLSNLIKVKIVREDLGAQ